MKALRQVPEVRKHVRIERRKSVTPPLALVRKAIETSERTRDSYDEIWCLFDVEWPERHPDLTTALDLAKQNGIKVAASNPCFELWLILHFRQQYQQLSTEEAERRRAAEDDSKGKEVEGAKYMDRRNLAVERAQQLKAMHKEQSRGFPDNNPSSGVYKLLESIRQAGSGHSSSPG